MHLRTCCKVVRRPTYVRARMKCTITMDPLAKRYAYGRMCQAHTHHNISNIRCVVYEESSIRRVSHGTDARAIHHKAERKRRERERREQKKSRRSTEHKKWCFGATHFPACSVLMLNAICSALPHDPTDAHTLGTIKPTQAAQPDKQIRSLASNCISVYEPKKQLWA